jgi:UDP-galactopyranose mutase
MPSEYPTVIVGSGPTGLSAAYHLDEDYLILEREERIGGLIKSETIDGFVFDYAGHIMFTGDDYAKAMFDKLLTDPKTGEKNVHYQAREAWCYQKGAHTLYPFQANTFGLPQEVIQECVVGLAKAYLENGDKPVSEYADFHEWMWGTYGEGICKHFMDCYNRKLWKIDLREMSHEWLSGRVPMPKIEQIIEGALKPGAADMGPNAYFGYPLKGGYQALVDGWTHLLGQDCIDSIRTNSGVSQVDIANKTVKTDSGKEWAYKRLITTMPLPELVRRIKNCPSDVKAAGESLRHTSIQCVFIGSKPNRMEKYHWIYYPEPDCFFHRIFVQGNASPFNQPEGCSNYIAEISYYGTPVPKDEAIDRTIESMYQVGRLQRGDDIVVADMVLMPYSYVIPQHHKDSAVKLIKDYLYANDIITIGRFGEWSYYNTDHAILAGKRAADAVKALREKGKSAPASAAVVAALAKKRTEDSGALAASGKI